MIRIFKLVLLLVVNQVAFGQAPSNYTNINGRYRWIAGMFDSTFHIPKGTSPSLRTGGSTNAGGLFYNTSDSSVYTYTGTQWIKVRGSINPSDTTNKYVTQVYKKNGSDSVFYVKGGIHTWAFNDSTGSPGGGGGGKVYYFNGGVSMGTFGGLTMYELGDTANTGAAANFTRATTGAIANFITDPNKPGLLQIPAGSWTIDAWMSETGSGANHAQVWAVLEKWNGSTITTIATSPIEEITEGNSPNLYTWAISVPTTSLLVTDRIIIQFYITNTNGKTVTLYTQNGYVGEVHTTFTTGIGAINGLTAPAQYLVTGTSGTDFNISSITATHTFNLPTASATNRGALSSADWTTFNSKLSPADTVSLSNRINLKLNISDTAAMLSPYARTNVVNAGLATKVNISDTASMLSPYARKNFLNAGTGISYSSTTGTIANTAPDQTVALNAGTGISISGTYPNFTITNSSPSSGGTVTSVGSNNGTGLTGGPITTSGTLAIDTLLVSTRAWRQKGVDSLQANINTKQNTLTLTTFGTGAVATLVGATLNIPQYQGALTNPITGTGTANYVAKFSGFTGITNSQIFDNSTNVGIGTATPDSLLTVNLGTHFKRGVRMSGLPTAPGTRALRVDANGTLSVSDTLTNGISGSGTTNYIPKFTSSSAIGNSIIFENSGNVNLNGNVAIQLNSIPAITSQQLQFQNNGTNKWQLYLNTGNNSFNIFNSATASDAMTLDASGNLGLGVTPSAWGANFKVFDINTLGAIWSGSGVDVASTGNAYYIATGPRYKTTAAATNYWQVGGEHRWYNAPSGTAGNAISFTQAMTLTAAGDLMLGRTTTSGSRLQVTGIANSWSQDIQASTTSGQSYGLLLSAGTTSGDAALQIRNAAGTTQYLYVRGDGNVGIGTTSPTQLLDVNGIVQAKSFYNLNSGIIRLYNSNNSNFAIISGNTGTVDGTINLVGGSGNGMFIANGGNVGIGTTSPSGVLHVEQTTTTGLGLRVQRNLAAASTDNVVAYITNNNASDDQATLKVEQAGSGSILELIGTGGTERMRITSGGNVGINTQTPNATFHVNGSVAAAISIKTATYTLTSSDYTVVFDLNGNATANLPSATTCSGRIYVIKINATNVSDVLTIDPNGAQTIDGNATYGLQCQQAITIQSDGSNWRIIADYALGLNCL